MKLISVTHVNISLTSPKTDIKTLFFLITTDKAGMQDTIYSNKSVESSKYACYKDIENRKGRSISPSDAKVPFFAYNKIV